MSQILNTVLARNLLFWMSLYCEHIHNNWEWVLYMHIMVPGPHIWLLAHDSTLHLKILWALPILTLYSEQLLGPLPPPPLTLPPPLTSLPSPLISLPPLLIHLTPSLTYLTPSSTSSSTTSHPHSHHFLLHSPHTLPHCVTSLSPPLTSPPHNNTVVPIHVLFLASVHVNITLCVHNIITD